MVRSLLSALLLLSTLAGAACQANDAPVAADLNSANPAVAEQARKVQELTSQVARQHAVIEAEEKRLQALEQQLKGAQENLTGLKQEVKATP